MLSDICSNFSCKLLVAACKLLLFYGSLYKIVVVQTCYFTREELKLRLLLEVTSPDVDRNVKSTQFLVFV
jgi:hypothetical protein